MQLKKLTMLWMILNLLTACGGTVKKTTLIKTQNKLTTYREPAQASCESVLEKCKTAVDEQKKAMDQQNVVIEKQDKLIKLQENELEQSEEATNKAILGGVSVSSFLLLLLLI